MRSLSIKVKSNDETVMEALAINAASVKLYYIFRIKIRFIFLR